ncbi:MAG: hypothetical protein LIP16_15345 [Clostridium sp.]|nr:hypothetical protein [Clostridium sp.]
MKKILAILLATVMLLSLAACGGGKDPTPSGNSGTGDTPPASSQQEPATSDPGTNEGNDWEKVLYLTGLTAPEGSTVKKSGYTKVIFEKDGGFTTEEKKACLQMLWDACMDVSAHGIYHLNKDTDTVSETYTSLDDRLASREDWETGSISWYFTNKDNFWIWMVVNVGYDGEISADVTAGRQVK